MKATAVFYSTRDPACPLHPLSSVLPTGRARNDMSATLHLFPLSSPACLAVSPHQTRELAFSSASHSITSSIKLICYRKEFIFPLCLPTIKHTCGERAGPSTRGAGQTRARFLMPPVRPREDHPALLIREMKHSLNKA